MALNIKDAETDRLARLAEMQAIAAHAASLPVISEEDPIEWDENGLSV